MAVLELSAARAGSDLLTVPDGCRLLVLTDGIRCGAHAMTLPFADATIIAEIPDLAGLPADEPYDLVAVDRDSLDLETLAELSILVRPLLRPAGAMIVMLDAGGSSSMPSARFLVGWEWAGLVDLDNRLAAAVCPGPQDAVADGPFVAAWTSAGLAAGREIKARRHAEAALDRQISLTYQTERALLEGMVALAEEAEVVRREHQGLALARTVLRGSKAGRAILRTARVLRGRGR
jgi:hypothetical protein